jgi:hypothetical protein
MLTCRTVLIAEWALVETPNAVLSAGAGITTKYNFPNAYSIMQRIEPAIYACVGLMLSGLYLYHAYIMFRSNADKKVRQLLIRLLYTNTFLVALGLGNIISEYVGGAIVQTGYIAFFYSFVCSSSIVTLTSRLTSLLAIVNRAMDAQRNRYINNAIIGEVRAVRLQGAEI